MNEGGEQKHPGRTRSPNLSRGGWLPTALCFALGSLASLGVLACGSNPAPARAHPPAASATGGSAAQGSAQAPRPPDGATLTPTQVAAKSTPAIVTIRGKNSLGTGFIVHQDGWVVTNLHVIEAASELSVTLADGAKFAVTDVMAVDDQRDLALLRIPKKQPFPTLPIGDSSKVHAGDPIVAIGHPLGLEDTVSNGLVSAVRVVDPTLTVLQISAPIAPGSSGGPIFNALGEVIGVTTAYSAEGQNLNFGIPIDYLKAMMVNPKPVPFAAFALTIVKKDKAPRRNIPHHATRIFRGCGNGDIRIISRGLSGAIHVGAPLYNSGDYAGCYHLYEGAALDVERKLSKSCVGPKRALSEGRKTASRQKDSSSQAWAMRDAFDGLFDVIDRVNPNED